MSSKDNQEPPLSKEEERERDMKYHVYVRLPFKRGDFVDPRPVSWSRLIARRWSETKLHLQAEWDETKSEALWSIISGVAQTEIACQHNPLRPPLGVLATY